MTIPNEIKKKILKLAKQQWTPPGVEIVTVDDRSNETYITNCVKHGRKRQLLLCEGFVTLGNNYIAFHEIGYGAICLYDIKRNTLRTSKNGIFLEHLAVLGDYYGYSPKPEIFFKVDHYV